MMGYGMMGMGGFFPALFMIIYLVLVVYFFYLLASMNTSLKRIADRLEKYPVETNRKNDDSDVR